MTPALPSGSAVRAVLLMATVAVHALLLLVFTRSRSHETPASPQQPALLLLPEWKEPEVQLPPPPPPPERAPSPARHVVPTSTPPPPSAPRRAPIDWHSQASQTAHDRVDREEALERYHRFAAPKRDPGPLIPDPPKLFNVYPEKKGTVEKTPDGRLLYWLSENCNQQIEEDGDVSFTRCYLDLERPHVRGDLFEHLKPGYLKPERLPEPK